MNKHSNKLCNEFDTPPGHQYYLIIKMHWAMPCDRLTITKAGVRCLKIEIKSMLYIMMYQLEVIRSYKLNENIVVSK